MQSRYGVKHGSLFFLLFTPLFRIGVAVLTSHGIALAYFVYFHIAMPLHKGFTVMSWILLEDRSSRSRLFVYTLVSRHELTTAMQRL